MKSCFQTTETIDQINGEIEQKKPKKRINDNCKFAQTTLCVTKEK